MTFYRLPFATVIGRNVILNPSFELPALTYGWEKGANAVDFLSTGRLDAPGKRALMWTGAGDSGVRTVKITPDPILGLSTTYYYKFRIRKQYNSNTATQAQVKWTFYGPTDAVVGTPTWTTVPGTLSEAWLDVAGTVPVPAAVAFVLDIRVLGANGTGGFVVDDVIAGPYDVPYFDGDTGPDLDGEASTFAYWALGKHTSASVLTAATPDDVRAAALDVALPFESNRETRTIVAQLLDSDRTRATFVPAGLRTGTFLAVCDDPADATGLQEWFTTAGLYAHADDDGAAHADMLFHPARGGLQLQQREDGATTLAVPFVEVRL